MDRIEFVVRSSDPAFYLFLALFLEPKTQHSTLNTQHSKLSVSLLRSVLSVVLF